MISTECYSWIIKCNYYAPEMCHSLYPRGINNDNSLSIIKRKNKNYQFMELHSLNDHHLKIDSSWSEIHYFIDVTDISMSTFYLSLLSYYTSFVLHDKGKTLCFNNP